MGRTGWYLLNSGDVGGAWKRLCRQKGVVSSWFFEKKWFLFCVVDDYL